MPAIVYDGKTRLKEIENPKPEEGEALIKVLAAGICRTDLEITQGYMDFRGVLGHEFVGEVLECGTEPELVGKRVVGEINIAPGVKDETVRKHAQGRGVLGIQDKDGCFAEMLTLPSENLHVVPAGVSLKQAVFTEPLAAALEILEQVKLQPSEKVAVVGDGKLGLLVSRILVLHGNETTVIGKHKRKLDIAGRFGAKAVLLDSFAHETFSMVVDCSGRPEGLAFSLSILEPRGTLVLKTTTAAPSGFHTAKLVIDEITVVGSRCGPFMPALRMLERGLVDVEALIEAVYPLSRGVEALEAASKPGALKVLLDIGGIL